MSEAQEAAPWTPDQPLRADATDEQINRRITYGLPVPSTVYDHLRSEAAVAREFAAACVAANQRATTELVRRALDGRRAAEAERDALRAEVERLTLDGIHTCHHECPRIACVQRREIARLREDAERWRTLWGVPSSWLCASFKVWAQSYVPAHHMRASVDEIIGSRAALAATEGPND